MCTIYIEIDNDYGSDERHNWRLLNYDDEKKEMLDILEKI